MTLEDFVIVFNGLTLREWFFIQERGTEPGITTKMSSLFLKELGGDSESFLETSYQEFLQELQDIYEETNDEYYWYFRGRLWSDNDIIFNANFIKIDKLKLSRHEKIKQLIDEN